MWVHIWAMREVRQLLIIVHCCLAMKHLGTTCKSQRDVAKLNGSFFMGVLRHGEEFKASYCISVRFRTEEQWVQEWTQK